MPFNEYFRKLREERQITKTELARRLRVSIQYIVEVESGRSKPPTLERCTGIAKALGLSERETSKFLDLAIAGRATDELRPYIVREPQSPYNASKALSGRDLHFVPILDSTLAKDGLRKGQVAVLDKRAEPQPGDLVAVQHPDGTRLLRYTSKLQDEQDLKIEGVVCGVLWK